MISMPMSVGCFQYLTQHVMQRYSNNENNFCKVQIYIIIGRDIYSGYITGSDI